MRSPPILIAVVVTLAGCQTTREDEWNGSGMKPFDQAERTCQTQAEGIAADAARPEFFVGCMRAFGWTPRPGTPFADPASAPDPS